MLKAAKFVFTEVLQSSGVYHFFIVNFVFKKTPLGNFSYFLEVSVDRKFLKFCHSFISLVRVA